MRRRHRRRRRGIWIVLLAAVLVLAVLLRTKVDPLTEQLARMTVSDVASDMVVQVVNREITQGGVQYGDLVTLERDSSGAITALTTNMQGMNQLKTRLVDALSQAMTALDDHQISIPLGNLTGMQMLSGQGPRIPVRVVSVSSADASFQGDFSEAGINQTRHRIMLEVALDVLILLPSGTATERVCTDVCVAETVLLGPVPESYTYFNSTNSDDSKYFASQ